MRSPILETISSLALLACSSVAQLTEGPRERPQSDLVRFEHNFFAAESGLTRIDILYRIRHDFFVFTRLPSVTEETYTANGDIVVELLDSTHTSIARRIQAVALTSANNTIQNLRKEFFEERFSFLILPGSYSCVYHIEDKESRREFHNARGALVVPGFRNGIVQSSVVFVEAQDSTAGTRFVPLNIGENIAFGKNTGVLLATRNSDAPVELHYSLERILAERTEHESVQIDTPLTVRPFIRTMVAGEGKEHKPSYSLDTNPHYTTAYLTLPTAYLKQGKYLLTFHLRAPDTATISREFSILWTDMPFSLSDLDFATAAMRYIASDEEYADLRSGSKETRVRRFEEFWKKKDPSPGSAYNEIMAEYFRRVDYAYTAFRTLKEDDGVQTDRGMIYILYGKPSNIQRTLEPGSSPKEVWTYTALSKKFVFQDPSRQGNYKLILTEKE